MPGWINYLGNSIIISEDRYLEKRTKPTDSTKTQSRKRSSTTTEYAGLTRSAAANALVGYPTGNSDDRTTRSYQAIGGGGYKVIQILDQAQSAWLDDPSSEE